MKCSELSRGFMTCKIEIGRMKTYNVVYSRMMPCQAVYDSSEAVGHPYHPTHVLVRAHTGVHTI